MCEVNAAAGAQITRDLRQLTRAGWRQRTGAERNAVRRAVIKVYEAAERVTVGKNSRQSENGPRRIVWMNRKFYVGRLCGRHDLLDKPGEVVPQPFRVDVAIRV